MNSKNLQKKFSKEYKKFFCYNYLVYSAPLILSRTSGGEFRECHSAKSALPLRIYVGLEKPPKKGRSKRHNGVQLNSIFYYSGRDEKYITSSIMEVLPFSDRVKKFIDREFPGLGSFYLNILVEGAYGIGLDFEYSLVLCITKLLITLADKEDISEEAFLFLCYEFMKAINSYETILPFYVALHGGEVPYVMLPHNDRSYESNQVTSQMKNIVPLDTFAKQSAKAVNRSIDFCIVFSGIFLNNHYISSDKICIKGEGNTKEESVFLWNHSNKLLDRVNEYAIEALGNLFFQSLGEDDVNEKIRLLSTPRMFLYTFRWLSSSFVKAVSYIWQYSGKLYRRAIIPGNRLLAGGSIVLAMTYNRHRKDFKSILSRHMKRDYPDAYVVYNSWEDGLEKSGLTLEQDFSANALYPGLPKGLYKFSNVSSIYKIGRFHDILDDPDIDVIFDLSDMKIYVSGQKISAKEVGSQTTAVEIMQYVFREETLEIWNKKLPKNSYTKAKNTLNSKIINPLKKVIRQRTGKELQLIATGQLYSFLITFEESSLNVGILEKIA